MTIDDVRSLSASRVQRLTQGGAGNAWAISEIRIHCNLTNTWQWWKISKARRPDIFFGSGRRLGRGLRTIFRPESARYDVHEM